MMEVSNLVIELFSVSDQSALFATQSPHGVPPAAAV